ncbi:hypothetical protein FSP39_001654 [Pinctada imbricata]|uniref:G-protein coupled receptors family 1 profile domain-containing protein n=1 Tax=Pinctada imbricata TaxID=66713 RepID=A0AA88XP54_PINIB|nr:hypothetical protein FSP39_001654 [Pinctada imbricata]
MESTTEYYNTTKDNLLNITSIDGYVNTTNNNTFSPDLSNPFLKNILLYARLCYCGLKKGFICDLLPASDLYQDLSFGLPDSSKYALVVIYVVIITISLFGNALVVLSFLCNRNMRSTTNLFILSLAISDILLTVTTTPFNLGTVLTTTWIYGSFACKLVPAMMTFCVANSSLTLCCIAFDRFYAIVYPFKVRFFQATTRTVPLLVLVWIISLVAATPQAVNYSLVEFKSICGEITELCLSPVMDTEAIASLYQWLPFCLLFALPLAIMVGLYGIIIRKLWLKRKIGVGVKVADSFRLMQKKRAIKMLVTVLAVFVVCWMPLQCFLAISAKSTSLSADDEFHLKMYLHCFALSSCCYNPIVYAFMNENFRKSFKTFLRCTKKKVHPVSTLQATERNSVQQRKKIGERRSRETYETQC